MRQSSLKNASYSESRKYLSALPKATEAASGTPSRKSREIRAGGGAGESESAARVLLAEYIELLPPEIAAELEIVARAIPKEGGRNRVGLIAIEGLLRIGERLDAAREDQRRRSPVQRILIVAVNPRRARNVFAIFEVGLDASRQPAELIAEGPKQSPPEPVKPVGAAGESKGVGGVQETENIGIILARVLKCKVAVHLVLAIDGLIPAGFKLS